MEDIAWAEGGRGRGRRPSGERFFVRADRRSAVNNTIFIIIYSTTKTIIIIIIAIIIIYCIGNPASLLLSTMPIYGLNHISYIDATDDDEQSVVRQSCLGSVLGRHCHCQHVTRNRRTS